MTRRLLLCMHLALALGVPGCAGYYYGERGGAAVRTDVLQANYQAVDRLLDPVAST